MSGSTSFDQACSGDFGPSPGFVINRGAVSGPGTIGPAYYAFARAVIAETKASVTVTQNGCLGRMQTKSERPLPTQSGHSRPANAAPAQKNVCLLTSDCHKDYTSPNTSISFDTSNEIDVSWIYE